MIPSGTAPSTRFTAFPSLRSLAKDGWREAQVWARTPILSAKYEMQNKEDRQRVRHGIIVLMFSRNQLDDRIRHETEREPLRDGISKGHHDDRQKCRKRFCEVIESNV